MSDQELLAGVVDRDPEAFRALMERHAAGIINLSYRFLGTVADSEDVAQEVFLRLYLHPPQLSPETKLFTWLYRVTVNLCLDLLRKRSTRPASISLEHPAEGTSEEDLPLAQTLPDRSAVNPRDQVAQAEVAALTRQAIAALPTPLRAPLILSTFEELSHQAIAQVLRISPKAVERRLARARELLKIRLTPYL